MITPPDTRSMGESLADELSLDHPVRVDWYRYSSAKATCRLRNGVYIVRISLFYHDAPPEVIRSLALSVLCRITKRRDPHAAVYRTYIASPSGAEKFRAWRQLHGKKVLRGSTGAHHDLRQAFRRVNRQYFNGTIPDITLTWGRESRRRLGHYDAHHTTIVVSRIFDRPSVPDVLVDFIIYHELLHFVIPTAIRNGRRVIHPPEFRRRERLFHDYPRVKEMLKRLR